MPITRLGKGALANLALGKTNITAYCSTGACLVVGNGNVAHSATSTFLSGASKAIAALSGAPTISAFTALSTNVDLTFNATFQSSEANFAWEEWGIYNATSSSADGYLLNRYVGTIGTKTCAQSWAMTATITLTT